VKQLQTGRHSSDDDDDDEDEADEDKSRTGGENAMDVDQDFGAKSSQSVSVKEDSFQLVEHSPDELEAVNRDVLNAEITQLEGRPVYT
jgi:structural maintenance of chromosome 4